MEKSKKVSYLKRFLLLFKPHRGLLVIIILISVVHRMIALVNPWLARLIMNEVIVGKPVLQFDERQRILWGIGGALLVLAVVQAVTFFIHSNLLAKLLWKIIFDVRQQLNWHLQKLSLSFYSHQKTGRLVSGSLTISTRLPILSVRVWSISCWTVFLL